MAEMGRGFLKFGVGHGLWVSQVQRGFDKFVDLSSPLWLLKSSGVGWVVNQCGLWWVVVALRLRIVVDRCVDRSGGGVEISLFFWVIMWWLFLMDVAIVGGF